VRSDQNPPPGPGAPENRMSRRRKPSQRRPSGRLAPGPVPGLSPAALPATAVFSLEVPALRRADDQPDRLPHGPSEPPARNTPSRLLPPWFFTSEPPTHIPNVTVSRARMPPPIRQTTLPRTVRMMLFVEQFMVVRVLIPSPAGLDGRSLAFRASVGTLPCRRLCGSGLAKGFRFESGHPALLHVPSDAIVPGVVGGSALRGASRPLAGMAVGGCGPVGGRGARFPRGTTSVHEADQRGPASETEVEGRCPVPRQHAAGSPENRDGGAAERCSGRGGRSWLLPREVEGTYEAGWPGAKGAGDEVVRSRALSGAQRGLNVFWRVTGCDRRGTRL